MRVKVFSRSDLLLGLRVPSKVFYPYVLCARRFRKKGISINFCYKTNSTTRSDVTIVEGKLFYGKPIEDTISFLKKCRTKTHKLIWFDNRDSAGNTQFDVLPHVDEYWKGQFYTDLSKYDNPLVCNRLHTDFLAKQYGIKGLQYQADKLLSAFVDHIPKLRLGWNVGFGNYLNRGSLCEFIELHIAKKTRLPDFMDTNQNRELDVHCRFGIGNDPVYRVHRSATKEILKAMPVKISGNTTVPKLQFISEMRNAKIVVSPFGWGEICYRDFEAVLNGACLVKPRVDHIRTWPHVFSDDKTYVAVQWDLSDLANTVRELLKNDEKRISIARAAQSALKQLYSEDGLDLFVSEQVTRLLGDDVNTRSGA